MEKKVINVKTELLKANDLIAKDIRDEMRRRGILLINILSSPGAGKTSLIEALIDRMRDLTLKVIEGDVETEKDAERIRNKGVEAVQITTMGTCHLEANMIKQAIAGMNMDGVDILIIENVGNLICPSGYDLGEDLRMVLLSAPEGDDKPKKYPKAFLTSHVFVITKSDLIDVLSFNPERATKEALEINPGLRVFKTSAVTGEGVDELADYIRDELEKKRGEAPS